MTLPSVECLCVSGSPYLFVSKHVLLCEPTKGGVCVQAGVPECMAVSVSVVNRVHGLEYAYGRTSA